MALARERTEGIERGGARGEGPAYLAGEEVVRGLPSGASESLRGEAAVTRGVVVKL